MSAHRVDVFNFEFWEGSPPVLVHEQSVTHTRPGADGVGKTLAGAWGQPFTSRLTSDHATYLDAMFVYGLMSLVPGTGPVGVKWNQVEFVGTYGQAFFVDQVRMISCRMHPRLKGPGYDFVAGTRLITQWTFTPHKIA